MTVSDTYLYSLRHDESLTENQCSCFWLGYAFFECRFGKCCGINKTIVNWYGNASSNVL